MFCPNCGTQNPDTAPTCSKCNFQLKSAAAPKFKGTMLMMNQPGAAPAPPPPPGVPAQGGPAPAPGAAPPGAPRPVGAVGPAPGAANRLKGTMVGVAPMGGMAGNAPPLGGPPPGPMGGGGFPPPGPPPGPPPHQPTQPSAAMPMQGAPPGPPPGMPPMGAHEAAFSPPIPQAGVNPLGGTVAADAAAFGSAFGPPQGPGPGGPYGPPPQGAPMPYGPPAGGPPPYGAPPPGPYGSPPQQGYGPNPYGPPPQQGYGPPMGGMGPAPGMGPGPMAQYGQPGPMAPGVGVGTLQSAGVAAGPRRRNPLLVMLLPLAIMIGGAVVFGVLAALLGVPAIGLLALLAYLGGFGLFLFNTIQMASELKAVTRSPGFAWWPIFVPIYSMYWAWILVPQEVAKAKQMLGVQAPVRSIVLYIFLWPFALASDINDMAR